jgi:hypothetical protein
LFDGIEIRAVAGRKTARAPPVAVWHLIDEPFALRSPAVHGSSEVSALVSVYALVNPMRVFSSSAVVERAQTVVRMIIETYIAPNKAFPEFRKLLNTQAFDPLRAFSEECRAELQALKDP